MLAQYQVLIMCFQYTNSLHIITHLIVSIALWDGKPLLPPLTGDRAESYVEVWSATRVLLRVTIHQGNLLPELLSVSYVPFP